MDYCKLNQINFSFYLPPNNEPLSIAEETIIAKR